jgi:hypothetical protein
MAFCLTLCFTAVLASPAVGHEACGDLDDDHAVTAGDALTVLQGAVGADATCEANCNCDLDCSRTLSAGDALLVLRWAVFEELGGCCVRDECFFDADCEDGFSCGTDPAWPCDWQCVPE